MTLQFNIGNNNPSIKIDIHSQVLHWEGKCPEGECPVTVSYDVQDIKEQSVCQIVVFVCPCSVV